MPENSLDTTNEQRPESLFLEEAGRLEAAALNLTKQRIAEQEGEVRAEAEERLAAIKIVSQIALGVVKNSEKEN